MRNLGFFYAEITADLCNIASIYTCITQVKFVPYNTHITRKLHAMYTCYKPLK